MANYQAHDDLLSQGYRDQRNQAAAQNDLQRLYMAEMGAMQGLNTGAAGQLALAQSAAYQGSLADLWAAESQDRAENDLAMRNLAAAYQGDMASAAAQSNAQLAQALYSEYVRQIQAEEAARQAAQAQANWQAQFDYQKQQDALSQQNWQAQWDASQQADRQSGAYKLAYAMLQNGVMPDSGTLDTAGISRADAQAIVESYAAQLAAQAARSASGGGRSSGRSAGSGSASAGKPRLTYVQAVSAIENGQVTDAVRQAYDYYMGDGAYDQYYGGGTGQTGQSAGVWSQKLNAIISGLNSQLTRGNTKAADGYLNSMWSSLSDAEKDQLQSLVFKYTGKYFTPTS